MEVIAHRYRLAEPLGSGGMARVHRAHDEVLARDVAIKLLREDIGRDPTLYERFLREARLAGSLNHPNIVRVYDAGVEGQTPWMAMELVTGPSLRERMTAIGRYPLDEAMAVAGQVLEALEAAHRADVVHRDIKPANILLSPDGAKLGDFGIAKSLAMVGADLTQANQFMGTPKYTAPEVALGERATSQSDLYAAAVVLWEMLAGHPPYDHANPLTLAMMHRTDPLPSLAAVRPDVPPGVVAAIESALAKDPADRPADAAAFRHALLAGVAGTTSAPPQPRPPAREPTRRLALPPSPAPADRPATPPPRPPARSSGARPWVLAVLVGLLVVAAVVAFAAAGGGGPGQGPGLPTATPTPRSTGTLTPDPATAPITDLPTAAPTTPPPAPPPPATPPPAPPPPAAPPAPAPTAPAESPPATTPPPLPPPGGPPPPPATEGGLLPIPLPDGGQPEPTTGAG